LSVRAKKEIFEPSNQAAREETAEAREGQLGLADADLLDIEAPRTQAEGTAERELF